MERYFIRAAKYFLYLCILFVVLYAFLISTGYSSFNALETAFHSNRLWVIAAAFILLPLAYPFFGFVSRNVKGSIVTDRDVIMRVMEMNQFVLIEEDGTKMVFRAGTLFGRIRLFYEDKIIVSQNGDSINITGARKDVVKTEFRLKTFL